MEKEGICQLCGKPDIMHTCLACGTLVCPNCYISEKKMCKICAEKLAMK